METDIVRKSIADYLHKTNAYRQQQDGLQGKIDAARRKIAWHEKRITISFVHHGCQGNGTVSKDHGGRKKSWLPSCGKWYASPRR